MARFLSRTCISSIVWFIEIEAIEVRSVQRWMQNIRMDEIHTEEDTGLAVEWRRSRRGQYNTERLYMGIAGEHVVLEGSMSTLVVPSKVQMGQKRRPKDSSLPLMTELESSPA